MHKMKSFPGCNRLYEIWHNYPTNPIGSSSKNDGKFCFDEEKNYVEKVFFEIFSPKTVWSNNVHMDRDGDGFH